MGRLPPFTMINLVACLLAVRERRLRGIVSCTGVGICTSFHAAHLLDRTAFRRIADKYKLTMAEFWAGNVLCHVAPLGVLAVAWPSAIDGVIAAAVHLTWGLCASGGTLRMDSTYVSMSPRSWYALWAAALLTELALPHTRRVPRLAGPR